MKLSQKQVQQLNLRQLESVRLLQMSTLELRAYVQELALENPLIEVDDSSVPIQEEFRNDDTLSKLRWLEETDRQNEHYYPSQEDIFDPLSTAGSNWGLEETLYHFISRQLPPLALSEEEDNMVSSC